MTYAFRLARRCSVSFINAYTGLSSATTSTIRYRQHLSVGLIPRSLPLQTLGSPRRPSLLLGNTYEVRSMLSDAHSGEEYAPSHANGIRAFVDLNIAFASVNGAFFFLFF